MSSASSPIKTKRGAEEASLNSGVDSPSHKRQKVESLDHPAVPPTLPVPPHLPEGSNHKVDPWVWFKGIGSPKYICAPMVDQSELAFRMLTRKYGVTCAYTPMFHAKNFSEQETYQNINFTTVDEDRPLFVQFCGNDPDILLAAGKIVEDRCDAVDINLGCPQGIARKGHYGSFLLTEFDLLKRIVSTMSAGLKCPVTCKIRLLDDIDETIKLAKMLQDSGCSLLTVHGRRKEEKKELTGNVNFEAIKKIKEALYIPVIANGGVSTKLDADEIIKYTGVDGVMTSEALLENPALFAVDTINPTTNESVTMYDVVEDYLDLAKKYYDASTIGKNSKPYVLKMVRAHLFKMLHLPFQSNHDLRSELGSIQMRDESCWPAVFDIVKRTKEASIAAQQVVFAKDLSTHPSSWYNRYTRKLTPGAMKTICRISGCC